MVLSEENIFKIIWLLSFPSKNFHNSEMVGRRKLRGPSMNNILA